MKTYIKISILAMIVLAIACDNKLDLEPQQSLSDVEALGDFSGLQTALIGAYHGLQDVDYYGRNFLVMPEAQGDNILIALDNSNRFLQNTGYTFTVGNADVRDLWNDVYLVIGAANNIINAFETVTDGTEEERNHVLGQALFLRALAHFDLVRAFGRPYTEDNGASLGVPVILISEVGSPARNTVSEVYTQVISDLQQARDLMNNNEAPFFASSDAANALLSRVYLYMGDNANAITSASAVIESGNYSLVPNEDYVASWQVADGTPEEIFSLRFQADETYGADNLGRIYLPEGYGDLRPTQDIMDLLAPEDVRGEFIRDFNGDDYNFKFEGILDVPGLASPRILRLAEIILNRAEAYAKSGEFTNAKADLNSIRTRAGLAAIDPPDGEVLNEVLLERRRELVWEGHRSFDIFRNGESLQRIECNALALDACTVNPSDTRIIFPIPEDEINANINMVQNPGYRN